MSTRPSVLLLIPHLGGGGAERVVARLTEGLDPDRFEVHLGLVTQRDAAGYGIPAWVVVHGIGARRIRWGAWGLLRLVRRLRPDVILSGTAYLNFVMLLLRPLFPARTRLIIRQNGSVAAGGAGWYRALYPCADAVICQTRAMAAEMAHAAAAGGKTRVLPNPVNVDEIRRIADGCLSRWRGPGPHLLAVGRLSQEKGFDLLLGALARLRRRFPSADLTILGEGRERPALEMHAWVLGLREAVRMPGEVEHPAEWFRGATLFVLPSRDEGLPNALLEAAAGGLPIVSTRATKGLVELLDGRAGVWMARETSDEALWDALEAALEELAPDHRFAHAWVEAFDKSRAIAAYEELIEEQLAEAAR